MTSKLTLSYDGGPFAGWALQPGQRTVAAEVVNALSTVLRRPVELTVAGRTDAGVHALGQVVSYEGPLPRLRSVNALLPDEVSVYEAVEMPDGFSARYDAKARRYVYRVFTRSAPDPFERRRALWWPYPMDVAVLHECAAALAGTHDFTAFTPSQGYHKRFERTVTSARWHQDGDVLEFHIEAVSFMRNMNRILVGTMLEMAQGHLSGFTRLLEGAPRSAAGRTAPPHGLYLAGVRYE